MMATGLLTKMAVRHENPVYYELRLGEHSVPLNPLLGQKVLLRHDGEIRCLSCNRGIKKTFRQGSDLLISPQGVTATPERRNPHEHWIGP